MADVQIRLGIKFLDSDIETSAITKQVQAAINAAIAKTNLAQLKKKFEQLKIDSVGGGQQGAAKINKETKALTSHTTAINKDAKATKGLADARIRMSKSRSVDPKEVQVLTAADQKVRELGKSFQNAGVSSALFGVRIAEIGKRFSGFFVWTTLLFKFMEALRATSDAMKELDSTAASLAKVLGGETAESIDAITNDLLDLAVDSRRSFSEVSDAMTGFVRTGLNAEDAMRATRAAMDLLNVSTVDSVTAQKLLTTTVNAMGVSWEDARDKVAVFSQLADQNAVVVKDLAQGFIRAGATANAFGISTEELAAMMATVAGTTQLAANRIGTAFKTILVNTAKNRQRIIELTAEYTRNEKSLTQLNAENNSVAKTLQFVAGAWDKLGDSQRTAIGQLVGGARRFTELSALMSNNEKFLNNLNAAQERSGEVQRKATIEAQTLEAAHRALGVSIAKFAKLLQDVGATSFYKETVNLLSNVIGTITGGIQAVQDFAKGIESWSPFLGGALSSFSAIKNLVLVLFAQVLLPHIKKAAAGFSAFLTASQAGIKKLIEAEGGRIVNITQTNAKYAQQNKLIADGNKLLQQRKATVDPGMLAGGLAGQPSSAQSSPGVSKQVKALAAVRKAQTDNFQIAINDVTKGLQKWRAPNDAVIKQQRSIVTSLKNFGSNVKRIGSRIATFGGRVNNITQSPAFKMASWAVLLQATDAVSTQLNRLSEIAEENGNTTTKATADATNAILKTTVPMALFGRKAAIAGAAIGALQFTIQAWQQRVEAQNRLRDEEIKAAKAVVNQQELMAAAARDFTIAQGLVSRGLAEWQEFATPQGIERRLVFDTTKLPLQVSVEVLKAGGVAAIKQEINELVKQADLLKVEWEEAFQELEDAEPLAKSLRKALADIGKTQVDIDISRAEDALGKMDSEIKTFLDGIQEANREQFEISFFGGENVKDMQLPFNEIAEITDKINRGVIDASQAMGEWNKNVKVSTPQLKLMEDELVRMEKQARDLTQQFSDIQTSTQNIGKDGIKLEVGDVDNIYNAIDNILEGQKQIQEGSRLTDTDVQKLAESYKQIAELTGDKIPDNLSDHVRKLVEGAAGADALKDRMDVINAITQNWNQDLEEALKTGKQLAGVNEAISKFTKRYEEAQKEANKTGADFVINAFKAVESIKLRNKALEESLSLQQEEARVALELQLLQQDIALSAALQGQNISQSEKAMISAKKVVTETRDAMVKAAQAAEQLKQQNIEAARAQGLGEKEISPIIRQIELRLNAQLTEQSKAAIDELGKLILQRTDEIKQLEMSRFDVVKTELEQLKQLEAARGEIGRNITEAFLQSAEKAGISDQEIAAVLNTGVIKDQLANLSTEITNQLNNASKVELAYTLQRINANSNAETKMLQAVRNRTTDTVKRAQLASQIIQAEEKKKQDTAIAVAQAMERSVVDSFSRMEEAAQGATDSLNKMVSLRADIQNLDKEITKLKAQMKTVAVPEELANRAGRRDSLVAQNEQIRAQIEHIRAVQAVNNQLREQKKALQDARDSANQYVIGIKRELGLTKTLTNAFGQIAIASETAANMLMSSEDSIVRVRTESAQASLDIFKSEYDKLKGFGESLFTASPTQIRKLAQANAILQNSTASMSDTLAQMPAHLRDAAAQILKLRFGEQGEELVARAGLERAGIDTSALDTLKSQVVTSAQAVANEQIRMVEEQQKTNEGIDGMVGNMERQIRQNELEIRESEEAAQKIEEMKNATEESGQTLKQQLKDAQERKKFLQGQLEQEQNTYRSNVAILDSINPGMRALVEGVPEQIATNKGILEGISENTRTMSELAKSLGGLTEKGIQSAEGPIADISKVALDDELLIQKLSENANATAPLAAEITALRSNIDAFQQAQINLTNTQVNMTEVLNGVLQQLEEQRSLTEEEGADEAISQEKMRDAVIEANRQVMEETLVPNQQAIVESTAKSAALDETSATNSEVIAQQTTESAAKLASIETTSRTTSENLAKNLVHAENMAKTNLKVQENTAAATRAIENLAGGSSLGRVVASIDAVARAVAALNIKINVTVKNITNKYSGGSNRATGLTMPEMGNLVAAAKREKAKMPAGSELVLANSSELVMTPQQAAKVFGQVNIPDTTVRSSRKSIERTSQPGSNGSLRLEGAESVPALLKKIEALMGQQKELMDLAGDKKLFKQEQNIKIDVGGKRELTVKGVAEMGQALEQIFKRNMAKITSKAESAALQATLNHIIRRLKEAGIDGV